MIQKSLKIPLRNIKMVPNVSSFLAKRDIIKRLGACDLMHEFENRALKVRISRKSFFFSSISPKKQKQFLQSCQSKRGCGLVLWRLTWRLSFGFTISLSYHISSFIHFTVLRKEISNSRFKTKVLDL